MEAYASQWLQFLIRWIHVIAGIAWIGASFYFIWLDKSLNPPQRAADVDEGVGGEVWAIHGGGFYRAQKFRTAPRVLPQPLHWFKWEAYATWWSGLALFAVLYWLHADGYLIDPALSPLTAREAVALSAGLLVAGWVFYDQLCRRLGVGRERILGAALIVFFAAVAWALSQVYTGRAMYIQVGAMLGTLMAANVLFVIIPGQRRLVDATMAGLPPDPAHGLRGKQRSVHNNYFTLPVVATMISNHYSLAYDGPRAWLVLVCLSLLAAYVRHFFNLRHEGRNAWWIPASAALCVVALTVAVAPVQRGGAEDASFAQVRTVIASRCAPCHSETPRQPGFTLPPDGVVLETPAQIVANAAAIRAQAVVTRAMPFGNLTKMTERERAILGTWIDAGAKPE